MPGGRRMGPWRARTVTGTRAHYKGWILAALDALPGEVVARRAANRE
jgi:hypothetical protein